MPFFSIPTYIGRMTGIISYAEEANKAIMIMISLIYQCLPASAKTFASLYSNLFLFRKKVHASRLGFGTRYALF
jgi:hypothetical protein